MPPKSEGKQTTPDDSGFDKMIIDNIEIFDLDKAPGEGPDAEPTAAKPAPAIKADEKGEKKKELTDEEKKAEEEKKKLRFKTHEEAEKGYEEKQSRVTTVEQENAKLREQTAENEKELKKMREAEEAAKAEEKQAAAEVKILEYSRKRHDEILKEIEDLDTEDPEHRSKVADLWSKVGADVRRFERDAAKAPIEEPELKPGETEVKPGEKKTAPAKPAEKTPPEVSDPAEAAEALGYVESKVKSAGRDIKNPVLQRAAMFTPQNSEDGVELSLDEQVEWAIKSADDFINAAKAEGIDPEDPVYLHKVHAAPVLNSEGEEISLENQMKHAVEETKKFKAAEKARIIQELNLPLSPGPAKPVPEQGVPEQGRSMESVIEKVAESRRL